MVADKKKIATDCFKRGTAAMAQKQWDYAIEMFTQAAMLVPENVVFRQTLRGCEEKKYDDNKKGARLSGFKLTRLKAGMALSKKKQDWETVDKSAEEGLALNPWDAALNFDMAHACAERGFKECAEFGYRKAWTIEPNNKEYCRQLALALQALARYTDAIKCWEHIRKQHPLDSEARQKISQLEASDAMRAGKYEEAESTRDLTEEPKTGYDADQFVKRQPSESVQGPGVSQEADLQRAIRKDPTNKDAYLKLAEYYKRNRKNVEALDILQRAFEVSGGDHGIREQMEDVQLAVLRQNLDIARQANKDNPDDPVAKENAIALSKELVQREIEIYARRVDRNPGKMDIKFELAKRYMRVGKIELAIPLLQQAASDARWQTEVLVHLGKCFTAVSQKDLALRQFEKAIPDINPKDKADLLVEAHYLAARLCEDLERPDTAEAHYGEVIGIDYNYKDARQRMEALQRGGKPDE